MCSSIVRHTPAHSLEHACDRRGYSLTCSSLLLSVGGGTFDVSLLTIEDGVFEVTQHCTLQLAD